jgi:hypothetical protein
MSLTLSTQRLLNVSGQIVTNRGIIIIIITTIIIIKRKGIYQK